MHELQGPQEGALSYWLLCEPNPRKAARLGEQEAIFAPTSPLGYPSVRPFLPRAEEQGLSHGGSCALPAQPPLCYPVWALPRKPHHIELGLWDPSL